MDSRTFTVQQIFQDRRQYRVPFYQRKYVWNREDQWGRLWEDIRDKAEARLQGGKPVPHFMGAVVLEPQKKTGLLGVERHHIIDGQQRLTTLQYVMSALGLTLSSEGYSKLLPLVEACLTNTNPETMEDAAVERFKLWPTFEDRTQYVAALTSASLEELKERFPESFTQAGNLRKIGVAHPPALEAICFFLDAMVEWVRTPDEADPPTRAMALASAVLTDLSIVCISLGEDDDAQVIFETLNGHGAQLHATDLIRNFIFMRAGIDADSLYANLWVQFESQLWSTPLSRGRLTKPRLEWFVQTAIQSQTGEEIDIGRLYAGYRRLVDGSINLAQAGQQLTMLNRFATHYLELVTGTGETSIATYGRRITAWDASGTHALAVRVAASALSQEEQEEIFTCIESYLVRRAVCGLSRKNYNKVFAQQLKRLNDMTLTAASFRADLSSLTGDASRWPRDEEFRKEWLSGSVFPGRLDAPKLRMMFHRLETAMRSERSEERVPISLDLLDIDHVLPQSWYEFWPLLDGSTVSAQERLNAVMARFSSQPQDAKTAAILKRDEAVPKIGNLTLVHYGVNRQLLNHEFSKKGEAFFKHSNLHLNRKLMQLAAWDEAAIDARGVELFGVAQTLWPTPN
jgi:hypothetical protein